LGLRSSYPIRELGAGTDEYVYLTEEEREANMHIVGEPRQGKSSFIEYLIREDIQSGNTVCLLDAALFEFVLFLINRFETLRHALGW